MAYSFASKFNKTSFGIDTTEFKYVKLSDLYNSPECGGGDIIHSINGLFVHKSQLGDAPVCIDADARILVNFPAHTTETIREILSDTDAVLAIKDGKVGYTIYEYDSHGKKCYSVSFVDR